MAGSVEYVALIDDDSSNTLDINADGELSVDIADITRGSEDTATFNGTITSGSTETLTVNTSLSDTVVLLIDDGTTGNKPQEYKLTQNIFKSKVSDFMFYDEVEKTQVRSWIDPAPGSQFQVIVENIKNSSANYRIVLESFIELS